MRGLLDTSVLIALETGREIQVDQLPDESAISVVTIAELSVGVHLASDVSQRARRLDSLESVQRRHEALPIDTQTAQTFAQISASVKERGHSVKDNDLWIAATAMAQGVALYTQDRDFEKIEGLEVKLI